MRSLNDWESVSLASCLELQRGEDDDEVIYSSKVIAGHSEENWPAFRHLCVGPNGV